MRERRPNLHFTFYAGGGSTGCRFPLPRTEYISSEVQNWILFRERTFEAFQNNPIEPSPRRVEAAQLPPGRRGRGARRERCEMDSKRNGIHGGG
jgi:hypothetical protein